MKIVSLNKTNFSGLVRTKIPSVQSIKSEYCNECKNSSKFQPYQGLEDAILCMNEVISNSSRRDRDVYYFLEKDGACNENSGACDMYISEVKNKKVPENKVRINPQATKEEIIQKARYACAFIDEFYNEGNLD